MTHTQKQPKEIVKTPNNLIEGRYTLDSADNKLYYRILHNTQKQNKELVVTKKTGETLTPDKLLKLDSLRNMENLFCSITVEEMREVYKKASKGTIEALKETLTAFRTAGIIFDYIDEDGNKVEMETGLINSRKYIEDKKLFIIELNTYLYRYLFELGVSEIGYTPINLAILFNLKSAYSQRLYCLLRKWSGSRNTLTFKIDSLREMLKLENKYPAYKDFKRRVILKSIEEINKMGNMNVELLEEKKVGRSVAAVTLKVKDFEPRETEKPTDKTAPATEEKKEPVGVCRLIRIENNDKGIMATLNNKYKDLDLTDPESIKVVKGAFRTLIIKDKNEDIEVTSRNVNLFIKILDDMLRTEKKDGDLEEQEEERTELPFGGHFTKQKYGAPTPITGEDKEANSLHQQLLARLDALREELG